MAPFYTTTVSNSSSTVSNVVYSSWYTQQPVVYYGDPMWQLQPMTPVVPEGVAIPESDLAWLKRRVNEICWVPA